MRGKEGRSDASAPTGAPLSVVLVNQYYAPSDAPTGSLLADVGGALAAAGHEVRAICSRRGYRDASVKYPRRERIEGVDVHRVGGTGFPQTRRWGRLLNYFSFFAFAAPRLLFTRRPDVVVSLSAPPLLAGIAQTVAAWRGARFVYWVMDIHPELAFRLGHLKTTSITGHVLEWSGRRTLANADAVIVLGEDMARLVRPYSNGSTSVITNWADGDRIRPNASHDHPLRTEWGWDGRFVVAYSGNMGLVHEFDTILDAATGLDGDDRYLFCFIGGGAREAEVRKEAARRRLHNVEFRDFVPDELLASCLTAPDIHLVSLRDNLGGLSVPSKTYSILAAGKPIAYIGPNDSEIAHVLVTNGCGVHIGNGDAQGLTEALKAYAASSDLRHQHELAARATFEGAYTRDQGLAAVTAIIQG